MTTPRRRLHSRSMRDSLRRGRAAPEPAPETPPAQPVTETIEPPSPVQLDTEDDTPPEDDEPQP